MDKTFSILTAEYRPMVVAYLRSLGTDIHLAEDLTQDTFLAAHKAFDSFENGNFGAWLRKIAKNIALMHWRATAIRPPLSAEKWTAEGIEEVFAQHDRQSEPDDWWENRREILRACIGKLSANLSNAIERFYTFEETLEEASLKLESSPSAVAQRLSRARSQLRKCMEKNSIQEIIHDQ